MDLNSALTWQIVAQGISDTISAISSYQSANYQQNMLQLQASKGLAARDTARLNALMANRDMFNNQRMIEQRAALQGIANAQKLAATKVQNAASGVLMNSASKYELEASDKFANAVDYNNFELQRVYQNTSDEGKVGSYLGQAYIYEGEAEANTIMADAINPTLNGIVSGISNTLSSIGNPNSIWSSVLSPSVQNNGFFGSINMGTK